MKALVIAIVLMGFLAFWEFLVFRSDTEEREDFRAEAVAVNYILFRTAVFQHVFSLDAVPAGTLSSDDPALELPQGWTALRDWRALLQIEGDGLMYCYVYGPARPEEIRAAQTLQNNSQALGWNDGGVFSGNGRPLPAAIRSGDIVSVIRIDE